MLLLLKNYKMFAAGELATDEDATSPSFEHLLAFVDEFNRTGRAESRKPIIDEIRQLFSLYFSLKDQYDDHIERYKAQVQAKDKEILALQIRLELQEEGLQRPRSRTNSRKSLAKPEPYLASVPSVSFLKGETEHRHMIMLKDEEIELVRLRLLDEKSTVQQQLASLQASMRREIDMRYCRA